MRLALFISAALLIGCGEAGVDLPDVPGVAVEAAAVEAPARVVSGDAANVAVTIYPDNLALITETRTVDLPRGRTTIAFEGVSDLIIPQTLVLREFTGVSLERNFDYDLLGRTSLFENSVGKTVTLRRIDADSGEGVTDVAEILSADDQNGVVVRTEAGIEGLFCSGLKVQEQFEGLPPGLAARPAMSVEVEAEEAGQQTVVISYLTSGIGWSADYRLDLFDGEPSKLLGWLTMNNRTATRYADIDLSVIAGQVQRDRATRGVTTYPKALRTMCWPKGSTKRGVSNVTCWDGTLANDVRECPVQSMSRGNMLTDLSVPAPMVAMEMAADEIVVTGARAKAVQEDVGDYKLYRIPMPVTVAAYQTKQIAFLSEDEAEVETLLAFDLGELSQQIRPLTVRYDIDNDREGSLAKPLPQGVVRVFAPSKTMGRAFIGDDRIEDTPIDLPAKVEAGRSTTVFLQAVPERDEKWTVTLTNAGDAPATVEMRSLYQPKAKVRGAERQTEEDIPTWRVTVPANDRVELRVDLDD